MEKAFYTISLYVDEDENLIGIPCGESDKYMIERDDRDRSGSMFEEVHHYDKVHLLKAPYSEERLEQFIEEVIDSCYSKKHNDQSDLSTIEKYTKKKGFVNATADYTLISIVKTAENYSLMPTFNDFERGPVVIDDDEHILPNPYSAGELAQVINGYIQVYVKANMFYKEQQELENEKKN